jgi:hypothetical protein
MRTFTVLTAAVLVLAACSDTEAPIAGPETDALATTAEDGFGMAGTFEITVENLTYGQPFTPPLAVTHRSAIALFNVGEAASEGVQQISENGNLGPALDALDGARHVADLVVAVAGDPPPVMPGQSVTFQLSTERGARELSFVSMLICTNDGFTGVNGLKLPAEVGQTASADLYAYDAGTEINTESFDDLVPPCPALTGVPSTSPGSGMSDPALAEGGVVQYHPGVTGSADLDAMIHGWSGAVGRITVERIG